jgi:hypothetical protein
MEIIGLKKWDLSSPSTWHGIKLDGDKVAN